MKSYISKNVKIVKIKVVIDSCEDDVKENMAANINKIEDESFLNSKGQQRQKRKTNILFSQVHVDGNNVIYNIGRLLLSRRRGRFLL